jgi:hypothetical protein
MSERLLSATGCGIVIMSVNGFVESRATLSRKPFNHIVAGIGRGMIDVTQK